MPGFVADTAAMIGRDGVRLISLMDHTPGHRQFRDWKSCALLSRQGGWLDRRTPRMSCLPSATPIMRECRRHRRGTGRAATRNARPLACHDDTTMEHVAESIADGAAIGEFPTTLEPPRAAPRRIRVLMGAPIWWRGGSHSGNVATGGLAQAASSISCRPTTCRRVFCWPRSAPGRRADIDLAAAVRTVTKSPAEAVASSAIAATVSATAARFAQVPRPNKLTAAKPSATRSKVTLFGVHPVLKIPAITIPRNGREQLPCQTDATQMAAFQSVAAAWSRVLCCYAQAVSASCRLSPHGRRKRNSYDCGTIRKGFVVERSLQLIPDSFIP